MSLGSLNSPGSSAEEIILVDDDGAVLEALTFSFETEGFTVRSFRNAEDLLAQGAASRGCYILDQNLPRMSGLELLYRLRLRGVDAPAVIVTSNPTRAVLSGARFAGAQVIEKPLLGDALSDAVRGLLQRRR